MMNNEKVIYPTLKKVQANYESLFVRFINVYCQGLSRPVNGKIQTVSNGSEHCFSEPMWWADYRSVWIFGIGPSVAEIWPKQVPGKRDLLDNKEKQRKIEQSTMFVPFYFHQFTSTMFSMFFLYIYVIQTLANIIFFQAQKLKSKDTAC